MMRSLIRALVRPVPEAEAGPVRAGGKAHRQTRKTALHAALLVLGALGAGLAIVTGYGFLVQLERLDDGPFQGVACDIPSGRPSSSVACDRVVFEIHGKPGAEPVIATRTSDGRAIGAWKVTTRDTEVYDDCWVSECHLLGARRTRAGYSVRATVRWTYGNEAARFHFDRDGRLVEFYLSW